jgi:hypothetical protein
VADGVELAGGRGGSGVELPIGAGLRGEEQESRLKRRKSRKEKATPFMLQGVQLETLLLIHH